MSAKPAVLRAESDRAAAWDFARLPDPVRVLAEERLTRQIHGPRDFRSPKRDALEAVLDRRPEHKPGGWDD